MNDQTLMQTAQKAGLVGIHQATNFDGQRPHWRLRFSDDGDADARTQINAIHANEVATRLLRLKFVQESEHPDASRWQQQQEDIAQRMDRPINNFEHSRLSGELSSHMEGTEHLQSYSLKEAASE